MCAHFCVILLSPGFRVLTYMSGPAVLVNSSFHNVLTTLKLDDVEMDGSSDHRKA